MIKDKKGIALITVLILSVIALGLVGITLSLVRSSTNVSGTYAYYKTALEAAKGGVDLAISKLLNADCNDNAYVIIDNNTITPPNGKIPLVDNDTSPLLGKYRVTATLLGKQYYWDYPKEEDQSVRINYCIYAIKTTAQRGDKKAIIDVVVKIEQ